MCKLKETVSQPFLSVFLNCLTVPNSTTDVAVEGGFLTQGKVSHCGMHKCKLSPVCSPGLLQLHGLGVLGGLKLNIYYIIYIGRYIKCAMP